MNSKRGNEIYTPAQIDLLLLLEADLRRAEPGPVAKHWTTITPAQAMTITVIGLERRELIRTKQKPKGRKQHSAQLTPKGIACAIEFFKEAIDDGFVYIAAFNGPGDYEPYSLQGDFLLSKAAALVGCTADYRAAQATGRRTEYNSLYHYNIARYSIARNGDAWLDAVAPATEIAKEIRFREFVDPGLYDTIRLRWRAGQLIKETSAKIVTIRADGHAPTFEAEDLGPGIATGKVYRLPLEDIFGQIVTQRFRVTIDENGKSRHRYEEIDSDETHDVTHKPASRRGRPIFDRALGIE